MSGFLSVFRNFLRLRREQWLDADEIAKLQQARLSAILESARKTPAYSSIGNCAFEDLGVTEKSDVRADTAAFLTASKNLLEHERTSGSSGVHMDLYFDRAALEYRDALAAQDQIEFGRTPFDKYLEVSHYNIPPFPLAPIGIFRKTSLSVFADPQFLFSQILKERPDILAWYPSVNSIMARINNENGNPVKLKSVFSGAEFLTRESRKLIEDSFSCPVFDQYASTEFGVMAWECPEEHSLHVNSTSMILEIVDKKGKPIKSGTGRIAVTGLYNHAMPLLRYSIGDLGSWGKECPCGRGLPVLKSLEGRDDDLVTLPSGKQVSARAVNLMDEIKGILAYQIVQEERDLFVFRYVPGNPPISDTEKRRAVDIISQGCSGEKVRVEFEEVSSIKRGRTGKIKTLISKAR